MLYKQAWKELKNYVETGLLLLEEQEGIREILLFKIRQLETRWKTSPPKSRAGRINITINPKIPLFIKGEKDESAKNQRS